jgi:hypothetical protein
MALNVDTIARACRNFAKESVDGNGYALFQAEMAHIGRKDRWLASGKEPADKVAAFLDKLCGEDPAHAELRREAQALAEK